MFKKLKLYKNIIIEILETLCTICSYLARDAYFSPQTREYSSYMHKHYTKLTALSLELRKELTYDHEQDRRNGKEVF